MDVVDTVAVVWDVTDELFRCRPDPALDRREGRGGLLPTLSAGRIRST